MALTTSIPSAAQAQALLTPAKTDTSVGVLNKLFGIPNGNWHSLYYQAVGGVGNGSLFFTLLKDLDLVVLAWVSIMLGVVYGIGAINTAHSGKTLGERYHTIWTPIRSATAMILLAPIPGVGLSAIQGLVLLMVWCSVGGANYLATQAVVYMSKNAGVTAIMAPGGGMQLARQIAQSEVAEQYLINFEGVTAPKHGLVQTQWVSGAPNKPNGPGFYRIAFVPVSGLAPGQLGAFTIQCASQKDPMCVARKQALLQMVTMEYKFIQPFVDSWQAKSGSSSTATNNQAATKTPGSAASTYITKAATIYDTTMQTAVTAQVAQAHPMVMQALDTASTNVQHLGWWSLGMYYWQIAGVTNGINRTIGQVPVWAGYDNAAVQHQIGNTVRFRKIMTAAGSAIQQAEASPQPQGHSFITKTIQSSLEHVFSSQGAWYAQGPAYLLLRGDPVANLQSMGDTLVNVEVPLAIATYAGMRGMAGAANATARGAGVFGTVVDWAAGAARGAIKALGPIVMAIAIMLFGIGLVWAYYIPSVPFIIWTMELVGWLIFIVEALVGGVLWAAAIALPEGEGIFGPRGDQGVMLFLNVMFRPALMVIGFFVSFILMGVLGNFVGGALAVFLNGMNSSINMSGAGSVLGASDAVHAVANGITQWNPLTWVAAALLVSAIALMLAHKIFGIIAYIPENVFRWIGGQGAQLGGQEAEHQTRETFVSGVGRMTGQRQQTRTDQGAAVAAQKPGKAAAGPRAAAAGDVAGGGETKGGGEED